MTPAPSDHEEAPAVACPKCQAPQECEAVTVIRPGDESLTRLFKGELNRITCSACGTEFLLRVPLVFRDDQQQRLIYLVPADDPREWRAAERQMQQLTDTIFQEEETALLPECRLTLTRRGFIEKISLHLHGMNDRLVEYIKFQMYQNPGHKIDSVRSELLYDFTSSTQEKLAFILFDRERGKASASAHIPMDLYAELVESLLPGSRLEEELEGLFPGLYVSVERLL